MPMLCSCTKLPELKNINRNIEYKEYNNYIIILKDFFKILLGKVSKKIFWRSIHTSQLSP